MKIIVLKPILIGKQNYDKGDILDLEVSGEKKKSLVEHQKADWYEDPKPEPKPAKGKK